MCKRIILNHITNTQFTDANNSHFNHPQLTREIKEKDASGVWRLLLAYKNMIRAIEHLGISMVFGEQYYGRGELDQSSYIEFVTNDALGQDFLNQSQNFAYWIKDR